MKKLLLGIVTTLTLLAAVVHFGSGHVSADPTTDARNEVCTSIDINAKGNCSSGGDSLNKVVVVVLQVLSVAAGAAAVVMVVVSGLRYVTSSGDANTVGAAKKTLIYALVGLVIVLVSQFLIRFVLKSVEQ